MQPPDSLIEGLQDPEVVQDASKQYRENMDPLEAFLNECCAAGRNYEIKARPLYDAYHDWAKKSNEHLMSMTKFGREMAKKLPKIRQNDGVHYVGIKLKDEPLHFDWN